MKIGILVCGHVEPKLSQVFGQYADMIETSMHGVNDDMQFVTYDACHHHLPKFDDCDGYIISGSVNNAYDNDPWILALMDWVRRCEVLRKPLVGICFGHQIIARALGGTVEKSKKGWGLGSYSINIKAQKRWMNLPIQTLRMLVSHQDQVITVPRGMRVIGGNEFCPNFILAKDNHILTIQGHPEFSEQLIQALLDKRRELISPEHYRHAQEQLKEMQDSVMALLWIDSFFVFSQQDNVVDQYAKVG